MRSLPQTVDEAVRELERVLDSETLDLIRGMQPFDSSRIHLPRMNIFGAPWENMALLRSFDAPFLDDAFDIILRKLHDHLVRTATAEDVRRADLA